MLGRNALICCKRYNWSVASFLVNSIPLTNTLFTRWYRASLTDLEFHSAISLLEVLFIREGHYTLPEFFDLSYAQLTDIIEAIATS